MLDVLTLQCVLALQQFVLIVIGLHVPVLDAHALTHAAVRLI